MNLAHSFRPFLVLPDTRPAAARLRRWLRGLYRVYGRAVLLETHR